MNKRLVIIPLIFLITAGFAYTIGGNSRELFNIPLLWILVGIAIILQVIAYVPAALLDTAVFYDLIGSFTFITMLVVAIYTNSKPCLQQYISAFFVAAWQVRLGTFLFMR